MTVPGPDGPSDPGLQPERTALAWSRTCLALMAVALIGARILAHRFGVLPVLPMLAAALAGATLMVAAHRRGRRWNRVLVHAGDERVPAQDGARLIAGASLLTVGLAVAGLAAVLAM